MENKLCISETEIVKKYYALIIQYSEWKRFNNKLVFDIPGKLINKIEMVVIFYLTYTQVIVVIINNYLTRIKCIAKLYIFLAL